MAPWCPACRALQSTWQEFAEWSEDLDFKVGQVDILDNPGLSGRFMVTSLPMILHVKDGVFRVYGGSRKQSDLLAFVDDNLWRSVQPISQWWYPDSVQMGAVSSVFSMAMSVRNFLSMLTFRYGIPEWACYIVMAVISVVVCLVFCLAAHLKDESQKQNDEVDDPVVIDGDDNDEVELQATDDKTEETSSVRRRLEGSKENVNL